MNRGTRFSKANHDHAADLKRTLAAARGEVASDLVIKNVKFLDVFTGSFTAGDVAVLGGRIVGVGESYSGASEIDGAGSYLVPGFIDSHVHIESSLMTPLRFQESVLARGTTTAIWDPHEIANVWGTDGIDWALGASEDLLMDVLVMVPSCVPSTSPEMGLETSGAKLVASDLKKYRDHPRVLGLAEMMNFPGLLFGDDDVLAKLSDYGGMRRDGHCPGLSGRDLNAYGACGIHSCHESTTIDEAEEKMRKGIRVLIREGSCAKNADTLLPLLSDYTSSELGFCSDDRNPADIAAEGHINCIIDKALGAGHKPENVFRAASYGPARAYGLDDRGAVAPGYLADFVMVRPKKDDWRLGTEIRKVFKAGLCVDGSKLREAGDVAQKAGRPKQAPNRRNLNLSEVEAGDFCFELAADIAGDLAKTKESKAAVRVIKVIPNQIITEAAKGEAAWVKGDLVADPAKDLLKIAVFERHQDTGNRGVGFVQGFGLKQGAIATSINHDSHNIIAVGTSNEEMAEAVRRLQGIDGGIVVYADDERTESLSLPIGGLMTDVGPEEVTEALLRLKGLARDIGCVLDEPFLQLSFLALPVIPALKITDKGLVDVGQFKVVETVIRSPETS